MVRNPNNHATSQSPPGAGGRSIATVALDAGDAIAISGFEEVDLYQRREKIFTRNITGKFQRIRLFTGWPLLIGYFLIPWLNWGERQAVLFDLPARKFYILGVTFWPQDFMLLAWLLAIAAFALFTFTSLVGRVWCGYTCPQTVWTAIFMWMEQVAEGSRNARMKLDHAAWNWEKIRKRTAKHAMWLGWAFFTGLAFVGYFTPIRALVVEFAQLNATGWALFWTAFFTAATYFNAGWLREQVCIYMCPYARFQSAMFDKDTLIVSYDGARGEPRGSRKRHHRTAGRELGDCIDCQLCVQVCPTGIDIRRGLQYQCIGCAHCIDACNQVMDKMHYPSGLIRYTTEHALAGEPVHIWRPRLIGYGIVFVVMASLFTMVLLNRDLIGIDIIRERGSLFQVVDEEVVNNYQLKLINKTQTNRRISIDARPARDVELRYRGVRRIDVDAGDVVEVEISLSADPAATQRGILDVEFEACDERGECDSETTRFFGPSA
jgi:cytochrome c oxidase accessory protein FixG